LKALFQQLSELQDSHRQQSETTQLALTGKQLALSNYETSLVAARQLWSQMENLIGAAGVVDPDGELGIL
jgi:outer membrane protein TolC